MSSVRRALSAGLRRALGRRSPPQPAPAPFGPPREPPPPPAGFELRETGYRHPSVDVPGKPIDAWKRHAYPRSDLFREYTVPRYVCAPCEDEFTFLTRPPRLGAGEIEAALRELAPWTYHCEAAGVSTRPYGTYAEQTIRFHRYRANLITRSVVRMLGPDAAGATLLDLGCNCGFFTLDAAASGIGRAVGLELRPGNVAQAEFLQQLFGVGNAAFRTGNVKDLAGTGETFDVVLNLGLMYHLSTPFEVMRQCYEATRRFCVVDTITHSEPFSGYHVALKDASISIEGDLPFELQPTYRGIIDTMQAAGFHTVVELDAPTDAIELYCDGTRRCLVGFRDEAGPYLDRLLEPR